MTEKEYYPIELFHWCGMKDENINMLIDILETCPEYVHETNSFRDNCLLIATKSGNVEMVKYIIENTDVNINHENNEGKTALAIAVESAKMDLINCYLDHKEVDIYYSNRKNENIYHIAARTGNADLIEKLLTMDKKRHIAKTDSLGRHCLFNLISTYSTHQDYWCFEVIQEAMTNEELWKKDINGIDILQFTKQYEKEAIIPRVYTPLVHILNSRTLFTNLNESLPTNEDSQTGKGRIKV